MTQAPAIRRQAALAPQREASIGARALAGEATALHSDLFEAIANARRVSNSYKSLLLADDKRVSLSEEAEILGRVPTSPILDKLAQDLRQIVSEPPHDQRNRILIGLMVDAFPSGRPERLGTYQDALANDLLDIGAPSSVVAHALREMRRSKVFLPAISEVLEAIEATARMQRGMVASLEMVRDSRASWVESLGRRMSRLAPASEGQK